ncbi:TRAP transporter small permease [Microvirga makkahensis]|uniref:TRAP transporter small permease protein n=1 Tax=Microvirga makkahensis TaxID=1128670 RepID=A0A7X3MWR6_9HYPH|nr:TRAP transporter small permease [Microvirga makkahensis]MXQ14652.1 TRAP transporter small permease subunit [Microvirga makkahensis]
MAQSDQGRRLSPLEELIKQVTLVAGSIGVVVFSASVIYTVALRFLFNRTPYWAEEMPRLLLIWVTFLGIAVSTVCRSHLTAGIMPLIVRNERARAVLTTIADLCTIGFMAVVAWTGWDLTSRTWSSLSTALQIPIAWTYLALPLCAALSCIVALIAFLKR